MIFGWLKMWWHCLRKFHRMEYWWDTSGRLSYMGCGDCSYHAWTAMKWRKQP